MPRRTRLLTCVLCAGAAIIWLAVEAVQAQNQRPTADADPKAAPPDLAALTAEIGELRERVTQLEERLARLEGGIQPLEFRYTPDAQSAPGRFPQPIIPPRQPQGEINGVPYYIIPLGRE